ncbi:MAG: hypothetical protein ACRERE_24870, partial [Candidatus Entotheonellia bacterium]
MGELPSPIRHISHHTCSLFDSRCPALFKVGQFHVLRQIESHASFHIADGPPRALQDYSLPPSRLGPPRAGGPRRPRAAGTRR